MAAVLVFVQHLSLLRSAAGCLLALQLCVSFCVLEWISAGIILFSHKPACPDAPCFVAVMQVMSAQGTLQQTWCSSSMRSHTPASSKWAAAWPARLVRARVSQKQAGFFPCNLMEITDVGCQGRGPTGSGTESTCLAIGGCMACGALLAVHLELISVVINLVLYRLKQTLIQTVTSSLPPVPTLSHHQARR